MTNLPNPSNLTNLLRTTKKVVKHHEQLLRAKGDHFNLFSILQIEARENKTHSAFIAELLNPKGCHLQKNVFLDLFLLVVSKELPEEDRENFLKKFDSTSSTPRLIMEFGIGNRDDEKKTGGRIDIYLKNKDNTLCIENKIYAGEQFGQVERYCNHNSGKNIVFYLTLKGETPSEASCGKLEPGQDFFLISYRHHIVEWLNLCLKEVPNLTTIRESINQYILLIKKLTHNLNMEQEKELQETMSTYLEEASYIANNYEKMTSSFKQKFRNDVKKKLEENLDSEFYTVEEGLSVTAKYSQLWINLNKVNKDEFRFGIESFSGSGHGNGSLFVGLIDKNTSDILKNIEPENEKNIWWRYTRPLLTKDGNEINLNHIYTLKILSKPESEKYKELVNGVVKESLQFIWEYKEKLPSDLFQLNQLIEK